MAYGDTDTGSEKVSLFNGGISEIYRLDFLWKDAHTHSRAGLLEKWNWDLDRVWCELAGDIPLGDDREKQFKEMNSKLAQIKQDLFKRKIDLMNYNEKMYTQLMDKEIFLRRLQQKLGKGSKFVDDDEDDWE